MTREKTEIELSFKSGKETCAATLFLPEAASLRGHRLPCIVLGNTMGATRVDRLDAFARHFAQNGFAALTFDYRSFGESTGLPREVCDIPGQIDDFHAAIDFAKSLDGIDPNRIGLWGASLAGGHVVVVGAERKDISAIASLAPTADCTDIALSIPKILLAGLVWESNVDLFKWVFGLRPNYVPLVAKPGITAAMNTPGVLSDYLAMISPDSSWRNQVAARLFLRLPLYRPIRHAKRVVAPLWVGVCDGDDIASPAKAKAMANKAPRGESCYYDAGHLNALIEPRFERVASDQLNFFRKHLS
jgi:uncharacterized protein